MKTIWQTIAVAFSMFSAIPTPQFEWNKKNMKYMMVAFPLIGAVIGGIIWAVWALLSLICGGEVPTMLVAVLWTAIPVLITGGVHLDGYADTSDALASHKTREEKLEIMKDPHVGSFAIIRVCVYFLLCVGFWYSVPTIVYPALILCFMQSRTLSGIAIAAFPMAKNTGLAHTFSSGSDKKTVRTVLILLDVVLTVGIIGLGLFYADSNCDTGLFYGGIGAVLFAHLVFIYYYFMSKKYFGGITGDLAGWFLQECELFMVIGMFLGEELL